MNPNESKPQWRSIITGETVTLAEKTPDEVIWKAGGLTFKTSRKKFEENYKPAQNLPNWKIEFMLKSDSKKQTQTIQADSAERAYDILFEDVDQNDISYINHNQVEAKKPKPPKPEVGLGRD